MMSVITTPDETPSFLLPCEDATMLFKTWQGEVRAFPKAKESRAL